MKKRGISDMKTVFANAAAAALIALSASAPAAAAGKNEPAFFGYAPPMQVEPGQFFDVFVFFAGPRGSQCEFDAKTQFQFKCDLSEHITRVVISGGPLARVGNETAMEEISVFEGKGQCLALPVVALLPDRRLCSREDIGAARFSASVQHRAPDGSLIAFEPLGIVLGNIGDVLE